MVMLGAASHAPRQTHRPTGVDDKPNFVCVRFQLEGLGTQSERGR